MPGTTCRSTPEPGRARPDMDNGRRPYDRRQLPGACLALMLSLFPPASGANAAINVFGGILTDNNWESIIFTPWRIEPQRPGLIGLSASQTIGGGLNTRMGALQFEVEGQLVRHFGLQRHWEANLPVTARLVPSSHALTAVDSMAFGIGLSRSSRKPEFERERGNGDAARTLIYWYGELARDLRRRPGAQTFLRLHHRSDARESIGPGASSNALVIGLRHHFNGSAAPR